MQRVLDIDLDFFLHETASFRAEDAERLDASEFPPWEEADALDYLRDGCGLRRPLPGRAVERHAEVFGLWRDSISAGHLSPPFSVTHIDAHADLGLGDPSWTYLLSEIVAQPVWDRQHPRIGPDGLNDGSWLAFAVACRWIADLTYVYNRSDDEPGDLHPYLLAADESGGTALQLGIVDKEDVEKLHWSGGRPSLRDLEPKVALKAVPWFGHKADDEFDFIYLTRSPAFTPPEADGLYDLIRAQFITEQ